MGAIALRRRFVKHALGSRSEFGLNADSGTRLWQEEFFNEVDSVRDWLQEQVLKLRESQ
jgi:hypothetical protein